MNCKSLCPKWPVTRKCCFFVPIRRAVIIIGYLNLVIGLLFIPLLVYIIVDLHAGGSYAEWNTGSMDASVLLPLTLGLLLIDVIMNVVMLIGAHQKNKRLLQLYFYFNVFVLSANVCFDIYTTEFEDIVLELIYFSYFVFNVYLLFLVYNLIHLVEQTRSEVQYVEYADSKNLQDKASLEI